jgi:predicted HTH domain antitoxin
MQTLSPNPSIEETLVRAFGPDLKQAAIEALAIEGYRCARLSAGEVAKVLGLPTSIAAQSWLAQRGIPLNYSIEDLEADRATLAKLFPDFTP